MVHLVTPRDEAKLFVQLVAIVTSGLSNVQTAAGLGRHMSDVHEDENVRLQKVIHSLEKHTSPN
jgi:hypothetical protein